MFKYKECSKCNRKHEKNNMGILCHANLLEDKYRNYHYCYTCFNDIVTENAIYFTIERKPLKIY